MKTKNPGKYNKRAGCSIRFEIVKQDGPARLGKIVLADLELSTPCLVEHTSKGAKLVDVEKGGELPLVKDKSLERGILLANTPPIPHTKTPLTPHLVNLHQKKLSSLSTKQNLGVYLPVLEDPEEMHDLLGACKNVKPLLVVLSNIQHIYNKPRVLVSTLINTRRNLGPDVLVYTPLTPPHLIPLLLYLGVDLVDNLAAGIASSKGFWIHPLREEVRSTPPTCGCQACSLGAKSPHQHNQLLIKNLLRYARETISEGQLRDMVEQWSTHSGSVYTCLRVADMEKKEFLEEHTPSRKNVRIFCVTTHSTTRPEVTTWHNRILTRYTPEKDFPLLLLLPCTKRKPYSKSRTHQTLNRIIASSLGEKKHALNRVVVTSPLGIVPMELEKVFPAAHYETPATGYWSVEEKKVVETLLKHYLKEYRPENIVVHLPPEQSEIVEPILDVVSSGVHYTCENNPLSENSQKRLSEILASLRNDLPTVSPQKFLLVSTRKVADYQFGVGAGNKLLTGKTVIRGVKNLVVIDATTRAQIATIDLGTGLLSLTLMGAERLHPWTKYWVRTNFKPRTNTVFSVGVEDADPEIRPGDEVFILYQDKLVGVGKAVLRGEDMVLAGRGVAVNLRHYQRSD